MTETYIDEFKDLDDVIQHFGVKGMRWGVRKSIDSARVLKAKESVAKNKQQVSAAAKATRKQSSYGLVPVSKENLARTEAVERELKFAKEDLSGAKILDKLERKGRSKYQLKMEEKYKKQGLNDDEASVAAYKNIRIKKILVATAVLTAAVGGYKIHQSHVDKIIKAGSKLQNIGHDSDIGIRDAFYSSSGKLDNLKYKGLYGSEIVSRNQDPYRKTINVLKDVRQASPKNAQKAFEEMVKKDPEFAEGFKNYLNEGLHLSPAYVNKHRKAINSISKGKIDKNLYEMFNATLVDHSPDRQKLTESYFKTMTTKGYNAIRDVNDNKYSGYKTGNPLIVFGAKGAVAVDKVEKLNINDVKKARTKSMAILVAPALASRGAVGAGLFVGGSKAPDALIKSIINTRVKKYKKKHPGTKMSNTEIARMIERGK